MNDAMRKKALGAFLNYLGIPANQVQHFAKLEDEYLHWPIWERAWQAATENALDDARAELRKLTYSFDSRSKMEAIFDALKGPSK